MLDQVVEYFSQMPSSHRTALLVSGLILFSLIETAAPLFERKYSLGKHAMVNIFFTLTTALVNLPLAFLLVKTSDWAVSNEFGILQWLNLDLVGTLIIGLLIMDFISSWLIHYIEHHVPWMWKFHAIHHSDQNIDTTSGNRHHPGESVFRFLFTILAAFVMGAPMWLIFLYQTLSVILTQFNHANVILPKGVDRVLSWFIVTPNMHHVHHHYRMPYSDMNYGNIFSFWDRIFKTYTEVENSKLRYGLDTHMEDADSKSILGMLKSPFQKYKGRITYEQEEVL